VRSTLGSFNVSKNDSIFFFYAKTIISIHKYLKLNLDAFALGDTLLCRKEKFLTKLYCEPFEK
jgi:hypothetical protein